jgi:hypothetical protein
MTQFSVTKHQRPGASLLRNLTPLIHPSRVFREMGILDSDAPAIKKGPGRLLSPGPSWLFCQVLRSGLYKLFINSILGRILNPGKLIAIENLVNVQQDHELLVDLAHTINKLGVQTGTKPWWWLNLV